MSKKVFAFYFSGITEFQDMLSPLLALLQSGKKCWVCIFDCHLKKRQFYYYTEQELVSYVREICEVNKLEVPEIDFFGINDEKKFNLAYETKKPELVFAQCIFHKYPAWTPRADKSKLVHFAWGSDGVNNLKRTKYKNIILNVMRYPDDKNYFNNDNAHYFGNFRHEQLLYEPIKNNLTPIFDEGSKLCYVPETFEDYSKNPDNVLSITEKCLRKIKSDGFKIIWKKREKGYPTDSKTSMFKKLKEPPDFVIEKDLYFPTSLLYFPVHSNINICFGQSCALVDVLSLSACDNDLKVEYSKNTYDVVCEFLNKNQDAHYNKASTIDIKSIGRPSTLLLKHLEDNGYL